MTNPAGIDLPAIVRDIVPERRRTMVVTELFGACYYSQLEPYVFALADSLSPDYVGTLWTFYTLTGGGFCMAPDEDRCYPVRCDNGYEGTLSADAFGITCCLYAFSHLSFAANGDIASVYARQYHLLRAFAMDHAEAGEILRATD